MSFITRIVGHLVPNLEYKLQQAGLGFDKDQFIKRALFNGFFFAFVFAFYFYYLLFQRIDVFAFLLLIVLFALFTMYMFKYPDVRIKRKERDVDKELMFGIRFLIIEIQSGVPLYQALITLSKNYKEMGKYLKEIINKVDLGTSLEEAIKEEVELVPSGEMRRVLWQIYNALQSGSDLGQSLQVVMEQLVQEQKISIIEYGRKLSPLAMMFLMICIVIPSIGIGMVIVVAIFVGFSVSLPLLLTVVILMGLLQLMFVQMVKGARPAVNF